MRALKRKYKELSTYHHKVQGKDTIVMGYSPEQTVEYMIEYLCSADLFNHSIKCIFDRMNSSTIELMGVTDYPFHHISEHIESLEHLSYLTIAVSVYNQKLSDYANHGCSKRMKRVYDIRSYETDNSDDAITMIEKDNRPNHAHATAYFIFQKISEDIRERVHDHIVSMLPNSNDVHVGFKPRDYGIRLTSKIPLTERLEQGRELKTKLKKYGISATFQPNIDESTFYMGDIRTLNKLKLVYPKALSNCYRAHYGIRALSNELENVDGLS